MKSIRTLAALMVATLFSLFAANPALANDPRQPIIQKASVSAAAASGVTSAATGTVSVTVPGAILGDACVVSHSVDATGLAFSCIITSANTAKVSVINTTTNGVALNSGTMRVFLLPRGTK